MTEAELHDRFGAAYGCDFEFSEPDGEHPTPLALCWRELFTGREGRLDKDDLQRLKGWPFPTRDALVINHYAPAELKCGIVLGWPRPRYLIDTFAESRVQRNGLWSYLGFGLLDCCDYYGLPVRDSEHKRAMQMMFANGGPTTAEDWAAGLRYCAEDVEDTLAVFKQLLPKMHIEQALIRGRFMHAVAAMEHVGVPIDVPLLHHMQGQWDSVRSQLIEATDCKLGVYDDGKFSTARFKQLLRREGISWPRLPTGKLDLNDKTFRNMARGNPTISMLRELRHALGQLRLFNDLAVGRDGRNRTGLSPFRSKTGRNAPSNAHFVFGAARAIRGLIKPPPQKVFGYLDYGSQEIAVSAIMSKDERLLRAYEAPDVYLAFGQQAGAIPPGATKATHRELRALYKSTMLGVSYSMGPESLGQRIGQSTAHAEALLDLHRMLYSNYWRWVERGIVRAMAGDTLSTRLGWQYRIPRGTAYHDINTRSLGNWITQANASDMMRCAAILLTEAGLEVAAPVHDAFAFVFDAHRVDEQVELATQLMKKASGMVLEGYECKVSADLVAHPEHYEDEDGAAFWQQLLNLAGPMSGADSQGVVSRPTG